MKMPEWVSIPGAPDHREPRTGDADKPGDAGVDGNSTLTSVTGVVLVVILALEAVTLLSVRQMISLHVFVGVLLVGPVVLKSGSTIYRFFRYYSGTPAYKRKGPPHPLLRVLGPVVILSTVVLLGSGIVAIFVGDVRPNFWIDVHQTTFWIWLAVMVVHLLGHLWESLVDSWAEIRRVLTGQAAAGRRRRFILIVASLIVGVAAATLVLPSATSWTDRQDRPFSRPGVPQP